jgi:hypothetical protein
MMMMTGLFSFFVCKSKHLQAELRGRFGSRDYICRVQSCSLQKYGQNGQVQVMIDPDGQPAKQRGEKGVRL